MFARDSLRRSISGEPEHHGRSTESRIANERNLGGSPMVAGTLRHDLSAIIHPEIIDLTGEGQAPVRSSTFSAPGISTLLTPSTQRTCTDDSNSDTVSISASNLKRALNDYHPLTLTPCHKGKHPQSFGRPTGPALSYRVWDFWEPSRRSRKPNKCKPSPVTSSQIREQPITPQSSTNPSISLGKRKRTGPLSPTRSRTGGTSESKYRGTSPGWDLSSPTESQLFLLYDYRRYNDSDDDVEISTTSSNEDSSVEEVNNSIIRGAASRSPSITLLSFGPGNTSHSSTPNKRTNRRRSLSISAMSLHASPIFSYDDTDSKRARSQTRESHTYTSAYPTPDSESTEEPRFKPRRRYESAHLSYDTSRSPTPTRTRSSTYSSRVLSLTPPRTIPTSKAKSKSKPPQPFEIIIPPPPPSFDRDMHMRVGIQGPLAEDAIKITPAQMHRWRRQHEKDDTQPLDLEISYTDSSAANLDTDPYPVLTDVPPSSSAETTGADSIYKLLEDYLTLKHKFV